MQITPGTKACPECRSKKDLVLSDDPGCWDFEEDGPIPEPWYLYCNWCDIYGEHSDTPARAIDNWNALPRGFEIGQKVSAHDKEMPIQQGDQT